MKKNISINISGIIFHIEEDGYETLRKYLDSVSKYFSTFEDSSEIMADIESRMAEIFLSKLNEGKQIITADDVQSLMNTMGSVNDFKAAEEQEFAQQEKPNYSETSSAGNQQPRRLFRDKRHKILGGVCSGIGSYLNVDPVWIRLLFTLLSFVYGLPILIYVIMWIIVPGSLELEEPQVGKKMFRDQERKVLGGVAGGVAAYLGVDIIAVRVVFILLMFAGGLGVLVYIMLWVALPEAKTLTDKMQMQGEPVTLSNIESNIKKNQNLGGSEDETPITKILLFPFRLIGIILTALAKIIGPLVEVVRVAAGIVIMMLGIALVMAVIIAGGVLLGLFSGPAWAGTELSDVSFPMEIFQTTFSPLTTFAAFAVALIPAIVIMLLGVSAIAKRIVFRGALGWSFFVLFFAGVLILAISIPKIAYAFKEEGEFQIEAYYHPSGKKVAFHINQTGLDDYHVTTLTLKGYDGKDFKLIQTFKGQGSSKPNAIENARMIDYHVDFRDSVFLFDSNISFKEKAKFRAQRLDMVLYIPYDFPFVLDKDAAYFISQGIRHENIDGNTWKMTTKGLECLTCKVENDLNYSDGDLSNFSEIEMSGLVNATIMHGEHYAVELIGDQEGKEHFDMHTEGNTLIIENKNEYKFFWKRMNMDNLKVRIITPNLERVQSHGAGTVTFENFETNELDLELLGAVSMSGETHAQNVHVNISGASNLDLKGKAQNLDASILGASTLNAFELEVQDANVEANGASHAKVTVHGNLDMEEGVASDIEYHGNPHVNKHQ